jgi:hypothetical protein
MADLTSPLTFTAWAAQKSTAKMDSLGEALVLLAERLGLDHIAAVALPVTIGNAADKAGMTDAEMIRACWDIRELGEYIASICNSPKMRAEVEAVIAEKSAA